jgi:hypothetical protein
VNLETAPLNANSQPEENKSIRGDSGDSESQVFAKKYGQFVSPEDLKWLLRIPFFLRDLFLPRFLFKEVKAIGSNYGERKTNVDREVKKLAKLAFHTLHSDLSAEYQGRLSVEKYLEIKESIKIFYLLSAPCLNPDEYPKIIEAEETTGQKHIGRSQSGQMVWIAHEKHPQAFSFVTADSLESEEEKAEIIRWWKANDGLIDHTFIAAENIVNLVIAIQKHIEGIPESKRNDIQKKFMLIDPYLYGIKMLKHDLGRLITQDRLVHELETQNILMQAGIQSIWREEPAYVALLNKQSTDSIFDMVGEEKEFMRFIFYFADFASKVQGKNNKLRRPEDFLEIIQNQTNRYVGQRESSDLEVSKVVTEKNIFDHDDYGILEGITLTKVLLWLEDSELGLGFSREQLEEVYLQTEAKIPSIREELGIK